jgi:hypothetical protein
MNHPTRRLSPPCALLSILLTACAPSGGSAPDLSDLTYSPDRFPPTEPTADTYSFELGVAIPPLVPAFDGEVDSFQIDPPFAEPTETLGFGSVIDQAGAILPTNTVPLDFAPPEFPGATTANERANVFLPQGSPPPGGWPWIVATTMGGYKLEVPLGGLEPTATSDTIAWMLHALVNEGFAVFTTGFEGSPSTTGGLWTAPDDPSGRWSSSDPYVFQEKVARWLIQRVVSDWSFTYGLNPSRGGCMGSSAGGSVWFPSAMGTDRAESVGSPQERASTRLLFVVSLRTNAWPLAFLGSTPNGAGHYVDALQGFPIPAASIGGAELQGIQSGANAFSLREPGSLAAMTALFMAHDEEMGSLDFSVTPAGLPSLMDALDSSTLVHAGWSGGMSATMLRQLDLEGGTSFHADRSEWWVGNGHEQELLPPQSGYVTGTFGGDLLQSPSIRDAVVAFALRNGDLPAPSTGGLDLDPSSGILSGSPNALQELTAHTITASGPGGSSAKVIHVSVVAPFTGSPER